MKICKKCDQLFDGPRCRPCERVRVASWRAENPEKVRVGTAARNPEKSKAAREKWMVANPDKAKAGLKARKKRWRKAHPEKVKAQHKKWRDANPSAIRIIWSNKRANRRAKGGALSKDLVERLFNLQKGKCPCCGKPLGDDFNLDHRVPLAIGGANEDRNIQLLRRKCNNEKGAKHPVDFMQSRGFLL